ncbi:sigma-70 family RNA polymerase sigma factor [Knoellia sp. S7-12]|uniref:RNA polymerase sigma factor n=1 Tax=Knoellia sp. S7-12 TaxID=3126698 RepID=UPI00336767C2
MSPLLRSMNRASTGVPDTVTDVGRDEAIGALFRAHCADLVRLGYALTGDRGAAEEAAQDAFISLHRNWGSLRDHSASRAYLRAAVVNRCRSVHRQRARTVRVVQPLRPDLVELPGADIDALAHEASQRIASQVRTLPTRQREVIVCRYYLDLTERQTAELLQVSVGSVKKHASRALAALHVGLEVAP